MKKRLSITLCSILVGLTAVTGWLVLCQFSPAQAAPGNQDAAAIIRYVATNGSDTSGCTVPSQPCASPQYAVDKAVSGDEIRFAGGVYSGVVSIAGTNQLAYITKTLSLVGGYSPDFSRRDLKVYTTTIDAQTQGRVMVITGDITVTLDGLQMTGGRWYAEESITYGFSDSWWKAAAGGGVRVQGAHVALLHSRLYRNYTPDGVGSGWCQWGSSFKMQDSIIQENGILNGYPPLMGMYGGGMFFLQTTVDIRDSSVLSNTAGNSIWDSESAYGGGIYLNHSTATIDHTLFQGNTAGLGNPDGTGGGLAAEFSLLNLTGSTFVGNTAVQNAYGHGGGLYLTSSNPGTSVSGNVFKNNIAVQGAGPGWGGGIFSYSPAVISNNLLEGNQGSVGNSNSTGGGAYIAGGQITFSSNLVRNNRAGNGAGAYFGSGPSVTDNLFEGNIAGPGSAGNGGGLSVDNVSKLIHNTIQGNSAGNYGGGLFLNGSPDTAILDGNILRDNQAGEGGGMYVNNSAPLLNNVLMNNSAVIEGAAIFIGNHNGTLNFKHTTLTHNYGGNGSSIFVNAGSAAFANTIIHNTPIGAQNVGSGSVTFDHTLRYQVITSTLGVIGETFTSTGDPAFAADGFHLTAGSAAVDAGANAGVTDDIDGEARPQGLAPDLGADESPYSRSAGGSSLQVSKTAGAPHWVMYTNGINVPPSTYFEQDYLISFANGNSITTPAIISYSVRDTFPTALQLSSVSSLPNMAYSQNGNQLSWKSTRGLNPGDWGWIGLVGRSQDVLPGQVIANAATLNYALISGGAHSLSLAANSQVPPRPIFPPLILSPKNGEMCLDDAKQLVASGLAGAGMQVQLFENGINKGSSLANASGEYTITWTSALTTTAPINLYTEACEPGQAGNCSAPSRSVHLDYPQAFWCPQRSFWEGDAYGVHFIFGFRNDDGRYATNDFVIPGAYGFNNTQLHLYSCCDRNTNPFTVKADGADYSSHPVHNGRWWTFTIGSAHYITIQSQCQVGGNPPGGGRVLIDPDGFVFNGTKGGSYEPTTGMFAPVQAVPGVTVTAYVSVPEWGGWMPWPAHLYNNQQNPQVTGSNGYFAFFTPPGQYYLQATGASGFETWRSPLIDVITQVVHVNIPLTPWAQGDAFKINLTPQGILQPKLNVPIGSVVTWSSNLPESATSDDLAQYRTNPLLRVLSILNPLTNPLGWDSGLLPPGQSYLRKFDQLGTFLYSDGAGHTGQVIVGPAWPKVYLPAIIKR